MGVLGVMKYTSQGVMKDTSHGFLGSWWVVYSQFMDLSNPFEVMVDYLLIEGMTCLGHWDDFLIVSILVHMVYTLNKTHD